MTYPWKIPNWVQGLRWSDEAEFYDADNTRIKDQSGYDAFENGALCYAGTPVFENVGPESKRALRLDRGSHWKYLPAAPWQGTHFFAALIRPGTASYDPFLQGDDATSSSNARITAVQFGSQFYLRCQTNSAQASVQLNATSVTSGTAVVVAAYAFDQETQTAYVTEDGVNVTTQTPTPSTTIGNKLAFAGGTATGSQVDMLGSYFRVGDFQNDGNTTPDANNYMHLYEQHTWLNNAITDNLSEVKAMIEERRAFYGAT